MSVIRMGHSTIDAGRIQDVAPTRRRLRRILMLAALCLLLAVVLFIVWLRNRPLTETEQRLVGTWRNTASPALLTFRSDRTVTDYRFPPAKWSVHDNTLDITESVAIEVLQSMFGNQGDESAALTFDGDDKLSLSNAGNGVTSNWQRIPEQ